MSQPILNQRPKTHYKLQIRFFSSHTSLFWTLPEQLTMLHHACEPTHPVPTSQDTPQTANDSILLCNPIHIQPPKIHLSKFQCSPYRRQKCRALQEDTHGRMKTCVRPSGIFRPKMVLSKLQRLKLPAPNLLQKCSQELFPRLKSFGFMVYLKSKF